MFADVVFPHAAAAYVVSMFVPVSIALALATEYIVYICFQRGIISLWRLFAVVLGVNTFSWLVGGFLSCLIPDRFVPQLPTAVNDMVAFAWACLLSTVLEYLPLWIFRKRLGFRKLGLCVISANVAGYILLAIIFKLCDK